jgi:hypothetical protein
MGGVELTDKEALGVYLLLRERGMSLDLTMSRLRKRLEDHLVRCLSVDDFENPAALYVSLPERPQPGIGPGPGSGVAR